MHTAWFNKEERREASELSRYGCLKYSLSTPNQIIAVLLTILCDIFFLLIYSVYKTKATLARQRTDFQPVEKFDRLLC